MCFGFTRYVLKDRRNWSFACIERKGYAITGGVAKGDFRQSGETGLFDILSGSGRSYWIAFVRQLIPTAVEKCH